MGDISSGNVLMVPQVDDRQLDILCPDVDDDTDVGCDVQMEEALVSRARR